MLLLLCHRSIQPEHHHQSQSQFELPALLPAQRQSKAIVVINFFIIIHPTKNQLLIFFSGFF